VLKRAFRSARESSLHQLGTLVQAVAILSTIDARDQGTKRMECRPRRLICGDDYFVETKSDHMTDLADGDQSMFLHESTNDSFRATPIV
jgi:hypothetical protein